MKKEDKNQLISEFAQHLQDNPHFYITDISTLTVETTNKLRRACFNKNIKLYVVKNTLLKKAMEKTAPEKYAGLYDTLHGSTSIMFSESSSEPGKLIKEFRKTNPKPILKAAFVEESIYIGDNQLDILASIKTKNEVIGDIIGLLQSPAKNVISALKSSGGKLAGIVKTLSEKPE